MTTLTNFIKQALVSLFTREWIEICFVVSKEIQSSGLPLYEGVD